VLSPADLELFRGYQGTIEADLAETLLIRARQRGYTLLARPRVWLEVGDGIERGEIEVVAEVLDPEVLRQVASGLRRVDGGPRPPRREPPTPQAPESAVGYVAGPVTATPVAPRPPFPGASGTSGQPGVPPDIAATLAYQVPVPRGPAVILEVAGPGVPPHRVAYRGGTIRVGRGPENDVVLADDRVSRRHGTFTSRQGALVYTDLGSRNGSYVNGSAVTEIALGMGDVVRVGNTTLTVGPDR
jgi:hypothetical protein